MLTRIEAHPDCRNLPMISFLILPMQRITRLPLLMDVSQLGKTAFFSFSIPSRLSLHLSSLSLSSSLSQCLSGDSGVYARTFTGFWILRKFGFISLLPTAFVRALPSVHGRVFGRIYLSTDCCFHCLCCRPFVRKPLKTRHSMKSVRRPCKLLARCVRDAKKTAALNEIIHHIHVALLSWNLWTDETI